jgi:hypothetical protein
LVVKTLLEWWFLELVGDGGGDEMRLDGDWRWVGEVVGVETERVVLKGMREEYRSRKRTMRG